MDHTTEAVTLVRADGYTITVPRDVADCLRATVEAHRRRQQQPEERTEDEQSQ